MTHRLIAPGYQSYGATARADFNYCMSVRRSELARVVGLSLRAEQLGFPTVAEHILDLAIRIQDDAPVWSYRQEIDDAQALLLEVDSQWRRASMHHNGSVSPAEFDVVPA